MRPLLLLVGRAGAAGGSQSAMTHSVAHLTRSDDSELGLNREPQARVRRAERAFGTIGCSTVSKDKAEIARALRQRNEQLIDFGCDRDPVHAGHRAGGLEPGNFPINAPL